MKRRMSLILILFSSIASHAQINDEKYVLSLTYGYANHELSTTYYPVVLNQERCRRTVLAEVTRLMNNAGAVSHFHGGQMDRPDSDKVIWKSENFGGPPFSVIGECIPAP